MNKLLTTLAFTAAAAFAGQGFAADAAMTKDAKEGAPATQSAKTTGHAVKKHAHAAKKQTKIEHKAETPAGASH